MYVCMYVCMYVYMCEHTPVSQSCVKSCCSYIVLYSLPDRCPFGSVHLSYSANALPLKIHIGSGARTPPGPACGEEDYLTVILGQGEPQFDPLSFVSKGTSFEAFSTTPLSGAIEYSS